MKCLMKLVKLKAKSNHFNANQKCWVMSIHTPSLWVIGKYRGKGRYIRSWIRMPHHCEFKDIKDIEMPVEFYERIIGFKPPAGLLVVSQGKERIRA